MAIDATLLAKQGPVHPVFAHNVLYFLRMALRTKFVPGCPEFEWSGRGLAFMALVAHPGRHWRMDIIIKDAGLVRSVRVMAQYAFGFLHRVKIMLFHYLGIVQFMTAQAQIGNRLLEQEAGYRRPMRLMTVGAAIIHRPMLEFNFGNPFFFVFMALETDFVSGLQEMERVVSGVGIMT